MPVLVPADRLGNEDAADEAMPLMAGILLRAAGEALLAASSTALFLFWVRPELQRRRASPLAFAVAGALALAVPLALAVRYFLAIPSIAIALLAMTLVAAWVSPRELVAMTGGPRPLPPDVTAVLSRASAAWERLDVGDVEGAGEDISQLDSLRTPMTDRYIGAWQQFMADEHARRSGERVSTGASLQRIREEADRLTSLNNPLGLRLSWTVVAVAAVLGASPAIADARACIGVELLLASPARQQSAEGLMALPETLIYFSEPGAPMIRDESLDLQAAAESRHDPDTYGQLVDAEFTGAHARAWRALDGRQISAEVFAFRDAEGALSYQRAVNRHACQYSTESFGGPGGGVGLRVLYSNPRYPIVEQYSWVSGARRFVVSVDNLAPPPDHERVLRLADQVMEHTKN